MDNIDFKRANYGLATLIIGCVVWCLATLYALGVRDFSQAQRAGTILIATGVISLGAFRDAFRKLDVFLVEIDRKLSKAKSAEPESEIAATIERIEALGGARTYSNAINRFTGKVELFAIAFGTVQSGYGDIVARCIVGGNN